jgi:hypothetical protein
MVGCQLRQLKHAESWDNVPLHVVAIAEHGARCEPFYLFALFQPEFACFGYSLGAMRRRMGTFLDLTKGLALKFLGFPFQPKINPVLYFVLVAISAVKRLVLAPRVVAFAYGHELLQSLSDVFGWLGQPQHAREHLRIWTALLIAVLIGIGGDPGALFCLSSAPQWQKPADRFAPPFPQAELDKRQERCLVVQIRIDPNAAVAALRLSSAQGTA